MKIFSSACLILAVLFTLTPPAAFGEDLAPAPQAGQGEDSPAVPDWVVSAQWLADNLQRKGLVILDARGDKPYGKGHIPGAVPVRWPEFASMTGKAGDPGWGVVLPAADLALKFAQAGVDDTKVVVVYADPLGGWGEDGRFLWMLRMAGLVNSAMLDGGFPLWKEMGFPTTKKETQPIPTTLAIEALDPGYSVDTEWVKSALGRALIVDSRSDREYAGAKLYGERRGGHLPGAVHLPYLSLFREDGTLKPREELQAMFDGAGLARDGEIAVYCSAGIRSAYITVVLRMLGFDRAANYDESFYTWSANDDLKLE